MARWVGVGTQRPRAGVEPATSRLQSPAPYHSATTYHSTSCSLIEFVCFSVCVNMCIVACTYACVCILLSYLVTMSINVFTYLCMSTLIGSTCRNEWSSNSCRWFITAFTTRLPGTWLTTAIRYPMWLVVDMFCSVRRHHLVLHR